MPPITGFLLDFRDQGGDASFFDTNNFSPGANRTILLVTSGIGQVSPVPVIPGLSGNGLTWALVASQSFDWAGVDRGIVTVYRGLSATPSSGVSRVQYTNTQFRQAIQVLEFANTDIGNLGANAIVGTPVQKKETSGGGLNPSVTMPAAGDQANAILGVYAYGDPSPLIVPGVGFIILRNIPQLESGGHATEFSQVPLGIVDWNLGSDSHVQALIGIELRNATPTGAAAGPQIQGRPSFVGGNLIG